MGIYSEIALVVTTEREALIKDELTSDIKELLDKAERHESGEQVLYAFQCNKYYLDQEESTMAQFLQILEKDEETFCLKELIVDDAEMHTHGDLEDDFSVGMSVSLSYDY